MASEEAIKEVVLVVSVDLEEEVDLWLDLVNLDKHLVWVVWDKYSEVVEEEEVDKVVVA